MVVGKTNPGLSTTVDGGSAPTLRSPDLMEEAGQAFLSFTIF